MVRISPEDELAISADIEKLKSLRAKRKRRVKKKSLKSGCCLLFLLSLIFFLVIITAIVAKTGLIKIPFFSSVFYRLPQPTRQIDLNDLNNLESKGKIGYRVKDKLLTIELTEEELTAALRQKFTGQPDSYFAKNLQVVILDEQVEIFGLLLKPVLTNLTVCFRPYLTNDKLDFEVTKVKIGDLAPPPRLASRFAFWLMTKNKLGNEVNELVEKLKQAGSQAKLQSFELANGKLTILLGVDTASIYNNFLKILNLDFLTLEDEIF